MKSVLGIGLAALGCCMLAAGLRAPADPWVFRGLAEGRPHAVTVALDQRLWIAYDAATCELFKAWRGGSGKESEALVYQPAGAARQVWEVIEGGTARRPSVRFAGYTLGDSTVALHYELKLQDGRIVRVTEEPVYVPQKNENRAELLRRFTVSGLPAGASLTLAVSAESMLLGGDLKTNGKWASESRQKRLYEWGSIYDFEGVLQFHPSEPTTLSMTFTGDAEAESRRRGRS